ncbi:LuxR C-terminal-related transcriptional regulator [Streptomyces sp. NPDC003011]
MRRGRTAHFGNARAAVGPAGRALSATLLEAAPLPLAQAVGEQAGQFLAQVHRDHGVRLHTGAQVAAIRAVAAGDAVIAPGLTRKLIDVFSRKISHRSRDQERRLASLTDREREVLTAIACGYSNAEIAERLHVAETTVKSHAGRILAKSGARDRVQAVVFAYDVGLVRPA